MAEKVLLDTDIGSDIDDAVCLAYLLAQPACDLLGITTVSGEPVARARLASALCRAAGRDVPIYPGAANPLLVPQKQTHAKQATKLDRWPHAAEFPTGEAVEFLRRTIRAHPGEITLLTIGPLTNIALLFSVDPEIPSLLKQLVMMCGVFTEQTPRHSGNREWNALLDPHATAIVYRARPAVHRSLGLDVTTQVVMPAAEVRARFTGPLLAPVLDFAEVWFAERDLLTFHDPLAAVSIFDDQVCRFVRGQVEVELADPELAGRTYWREDSAGPHEVALAVDAARFFDDYFGVFS
ncbi:MAG TPA: nucleoside hydrolase [Caldilineaceae bacterium]|nr:nucleoside hydrolase [Caldilineaceae bacterium]